jgi:hypothetical protein
MILVALTTEYTVTVLPTPKLPELTELVFAVIIVPVVSEDTVPEGIL